MSKDCDDACALVRRYLALMEAREIAAAGALMAEGAEIVFPGGARLAGLDAVAAHSAGRYRRIGKRIETVEAFAATGRVVVYCLGVLHGEWRDGAPFDGIRFIDRFEVAAGRIARQWVWNDAAERRLRRDADSPPPPP